MVNRALVTASVICCALVGISFGLFALDEVSGASKHQQSEIAANVPSSPGVSSNADHRGQPRRFIDGAASALISPFRSVVQSNDQWVRHGIPTIFGLLVYGLGLGYLARYSRGMT